MTNIQRLDLDKYVDDQSDDDIHIFLSEKQTEIEMAARSLKRFASRKMDE